MSPILTFLYSQVFPRRIAIQKRRLLFHHPPGCCLTIWSSPSTSNIVSDPLSLKKKKHTNYAHHLVLTEGDAVFLTKRNCYTASRYTSIEQAPAGCFLGHQASLKGLCSLCSDQCTAVFGPGLGLLHVAKKRNLELLLS